MRGTVKWWDDQKGFGFILAEPAAGLSGDVFVHHSGIEAVGLNAVGRKKLLEGSRVEFDLHHTDKGLKATGVRAADGR